MKFEKIGLMFPEILLPREDIDISKWAVIACDQYTSNPDYWNDVKRVVGNNPSALNLILPEIYLGTDKENKMIEDINKNMQNYLQNKIFRTVKDGVILVKRKTTNNKIRHGIMAALDLEHYDYNKGAQTLIRATEGTIINRLHPRIKIRKNASLELPHILVLIDDPNKEIIEPLFEDKNLKKLYDFDLMKSGGHLTGYFIDNKEKIQNIGKKIESLADKEFFNSKYSLQNKEVLLFAMGDGNHSFATAKALWELTKKNIKDNNLLQNHPARYALVEIENIHDSGIVFEPIHRVLFNVNPRDVLENIKEFFSVSGIESEIYFNKVIPPQSKKEHIIPFFFAAEKGSIIVKNPNKHIAVATLQDFIDEFTQKSTNSIVDYIHGEKEVLSLSKRENTIGFLLDTIDKSELFKTVILDGALPRKTFSMGEAEEKRYYLEARKIVL